MLKSVLMASVATVALTAVAVASDLPAKAPVAAPAHAAKKNPFEGFYVGVHAGYATGEAKTEYDAEGVGLLYSVVPVLGFDEVGSFKGSETGYLLGAQAGANWVGSSGLLIGAEVSGSWADIAAKDFSYSGSLDSEGYANVVVQSNIDALGIAKAKLGWANDTFAIYASAGIALAHENTQFDYGVYAGYGPFAVAILDNTQSRSHMRTGLTVGGGLDIALTDSTSIGVSYDYIRFKDVEDFYHDSSNVFPVYFSSSTWEVSTIADVNTKLSNDLQVVKVNLNYNF